ncbi:MAG: DUF4349 domain-containing protein [Gemmatimonadota bacterium]
MVALVAACSQSDLLENSLKREGVASDAAIGMGSSLPIEPPAPPPPMRERAPAKIAVQSAVANAAASFSFQDPAAMIIRTGTAVVEVDSLEAAISSVRSLAQQLGGQLANLSVQTGEDRNRQAILEVKVPSARFDDALSRLEPLGEVKSVDVQAQDVGEEYVDIAARVANARRLEERLIRLLENRTGKLEEVLSVERELARVREEIDRMEGRLRYLRSRISVSTLTLTVHEPFPLLTQPGQNVVLQAFVQAGHNFIELLSAFIASLGYLVPLGTVALFVFFGWRRFGPQRSVSAA